MLDSGATYECIGKGGQYRVIETSTGAGKSRGETLVVYRCVDSGKVFHREVSDFIARMTIKE